MVGPNSDVNQGSYLCCKFSKKMTLYNPNVDLVNDNVYAKFGHILSMRSQDIELKPISDINQGQLLFCKFSKNNNLQYQSRSCQ